MFHHTDVLNYHIEKEHSLVPKPGPQLPLLTYNVLLPLLTYKDDPKLRATNNFHTNSHWNISTRLPLLLLSKKEVDKAELAFKVG